MELAHGSLSSDDGRNIESQFVDSLLEIYENDIGEDLESIPSSIYYYLTSIPYLT
jgi:hypothetical protein